MLNVNQKKNVLKASFSLLKNYFVSMKFNGERIISSPNSAEPLDSHMQNDVAGFLPHTTHNVTQNAS